jgi:hypothetical protein
MRWILGSPLKEFLYIYLPAIIGIMIAVVYPQLGETSVFYALLAMALIDSGHVYTTFWRTFFYPKEMRSHSRYWIAPVLIFMILSTAFFLEVSWFWKFVVYATLFHHLRQVYGLSRWYQSLNGRQDKVSDFFLYALSLLPMLIYHFRSGLKAYYYSEADLFFFPNQTLQNLFLVVDLLIFCAWILYEIRLYKKGLSEWNRVLSVAYPTLVYGYCFLVGQTITQVLFPLLFMHGIAYIALMAQTLHRTRQERFTSFTYATFVMVGTAVILGLNESWWEENQLNFHLSGTTFTQSLMIGLYLTPLFCHYVFDAWIWKKSHHESKMIYAQL